jgi:hypothetical protein
MVVSRANVRKQAIIDGGIATDRSGGRPGPKLEPDSIAKASMHIMRLTSRNNFPYSLISPLPTRTSLRGRGSLTVSVLLVNSDLNSLSTVRPSDESW